MIVDDVSVLGNYSAMNRFMPVAVDFLARPGLGDMAEGRHIICGEDVYAVVIKAAGKRQEEARLEVHNRYIDIQVLLSGEESIGWRPRRDCSDAVGGYDVKKDIQFFTDHYDCSVKLANGQFAMFFPEDAHAPMIGSGVIHKIVIKMLV